MATKRGAVLLAPLLLGLLLAAPAAVAAAAEGEGPRRLLQQSQRLTGYQAPEQPPPQQAGDRGLTETEQQHLERTEQQLVQAQQRLQQLQQQLDAQAAQQQSALGSVTPPAATAVVAAPGRIVHVQPWAYLCLFTLLLASMVMLTGCSCYRMCWLAQRTERGGALPEPLAAALARRGPYHTWGPNAVSATGGAGGARRPPAKRATPDAVVAALPVLPYATVRRAARSCWAAAAAAAASAASAGPNKPAAGDDAACGSCGGCAAAASRRASIESHGGSRRGCGGPSAAAAGGGRASMEAAGDGARAAAADGGSRLSLDSGLDGRASSESGSSGGSDFCAVCVEQFGADDQIKQLPCGHFFHPACVDGWLRVSSDCPCCRRLVWQPPAEDGSVTSDPRHLPPVWPESMWRHDPTAPPVVRPLRAVVWEVAFASVGLTALYERLYAARARRFAARAAEAAAAAAAAVEMNAAAPAGRDGHGAGPANV